MAHEKSGRVLTDVLNQGKNSIGCKGLARPKLKPKDAAQTTLSDDNVEQEPFVPSIQDPEELQISDQHAKPAAAAKHCEKRLANEQPKGDATSYSQLSAARCKRARTKGAKSSKSLDAGMVMLENSKTQIEASNVSERKYNSSPVLETGQDVWDYMKELAEVANEVLPQEDKKSKKAGRRKSAEPEENLLARLSKTWGGKSYRAHLEAKAAAAQSQEEDAADAVPVKTPSRFKFATAASPALDSAGAPKPEFEDNMVDRSVPIVNETDQAAKDQDVNDQEQKSFDTPTKTRKGLAVGKPKPSAAAARKAKGAALAKIKAEIPSPVKSSSMPDGRKALPRKGRPSVAFNASPANPTRQDGNQTTEILSNPASAEPNRSSRRSLAPLPVAPKPARPQPTAAGLNSPIMNKSVPEAEYEVADHDKLDCLMPVGEASEVTYSPARLAKSRTMGRSDASCRGKVRFAPDTKVRELQDVNRELQQTLQATSKREVSLESALNKKDTEVSKLQAELKRMKEENKNLSENVKNLTKQNTVLQKDSKALEVKLNASEKERKEIQQKYDKLVAQGKQLFCVG